MKLRKILFATDYSPTSRRTLVPLLLFLATCLTTYRAGGLEFFLCLMMILTAHELGHFFTAHYYRVPASLPYFIPMPVGLFGTLGAVIAMHPGMGNRRSLFDIAVAGPLAGLLPALVFSAVGLSLSTVIAAPEEQRGVYFGQPFLFQWLITWLIGAIPEGHMIELHPVARAGWVGIFVTALNLIPIGQLDGGHILYALLRRKAHAVATLMLFSAAAAVFIFGLWTWVLMILLLLLIGPVHPPTADDYVPLGMGRMVLGAIILLFPVIGFTPRPIIVIF